MENLTPNKNWGFPRKRVSWTDAVLKKPKRRQKILPSVNHGVSRKRRLLEEEADNTKKEIHVKATEPGETEKTIVSDSRAMKRQKLEPDDEIKKTLSNWRAIKRQKHEADETKKTTSDWRAMERQKQREAARIQLDRVRDTAGFNHNMDAMRDFHMLTYGCSVPFNWG